MKTIYLDFIELSEQDEELLTISDEQLEEIIKESSK
tara:strand:- start:662 stop:769 length:108 start_codon:yes stop_codon:yes gene_type:complete